MVVRLTQRLLLILVVLSCLPISRASGQDVTEVTLKAAFLFSFARFTEWPADSLRSDAPISACIAGDPAVGEAFLRSVKGKQLGGRQITVAVIKPAIPLPACHLIYLSGAPDPRIAEIVATVRTAPVLTVSDAPSFAKVGGIIQLFVERGKMRFRINPRSAKRAGLALSSKLLVLADIHDEDVSWFADRPPLTPQLLPAGAVARLRDDDPAGADGTYSSGGGRPY